MFKLANVNDIRGTLDNIGWSFEAHFVGRWSRVQENSQYSFSSILGWRGFIYLVFQRWNTEYQMDLGK